MMKDERFPQVNRQAKPNVTTDGQFISVGNFIHPSAQGVVITGVNNYVGEGCRNISIFGSSGCVVTPGTSGVSLLHSSGIIADTSDVIIIANTVVSFSPKSFYRILLRQDNAVSAGIPTVIILEDTIGGTSWVKASDGNYLLYSTNTIFPAALTFIHGNSVSVPYTPISDGSVILGYYSFFNDVTTPGYIQLSVKDSSFTPTDLGSIMGPDGQLALELTLYN